MPGALLARGVMVVAWLPARVRVLAGRRHYFPSGGPLAKKVAAAPDDRICGKDKPVTLNGRPISRRLFADPSGRPLPAWEGCTVLTSGKCLLLMTLRADSFDGVYFGPPRQADILGKARPLWLR